MTTTNLHMYPSPFTHESRMLRMTGTLAQEQMFDQIQVVALWEPGLEEQEQLDTCRSVWRVRTSEFLNRGGLLKILKLLQWTWLALWRFRRTKIQCVNPHSLSALPMALGFKLLHGSKIIYDTHEFETETIEARGMRKLIGKIVERCVIPFVDRVVVTSDGFGQLYEQKYGLTNVDVVKNYPRRCDQRAPNRVLRDYCNLREDEMLFIYQGLLCPGRSTEILLDAFSRCSSDKHLVLMGFGELEPLVEQYAQRYQNIHFHPAVGPEEVVEYSRSADVGFCLIEHTCLSYYHTLPNKLLECLQGHVPVIVSDFPDMGALVQEHGCGWKIGVDADSVVQLVEHLTWDEVHQKSEAAARWAEHCTWENEVRQYVDMIRRVVKGRPDETSRRNPSSASSTAKDAGRAAA